MQATIKVYLRDAIDPRNSTIKKCLSPSLKAIIQPPLYTAHPTYLQLLCKHERPTAMTFSLIAGGARYYHTICALPQKCAYFALDLYSTAYIALYFKGLISGLDRSSLHPTLPSNLWYNRLRPMTPPYQSTRSARSVTMANCSTPWNPRNRFPMPQYRYGRKTRYL